MNFFLNMLRAGGCCGEIKDSPCESCATWTFSGCTGTTYEESPTDEVTFHVPATCVFALGTGDPGDPFPDGAEFGCSDGGPIHPCFFHWAVGEVRKTFGPYAVDKGFTIEADWTLRSNNECFGVAGCCCASHQLDTVDAFLLATKRVDGGSIDTMFFPIVSHTGAGSSSDTDSDSEVFVLPAGSVVELVFLLSHEFAGPSTLAQDLHFTVTIVDA